MYIRYAYLRFHHESYQEKVNPQDNKFSPKDTNKFSSHDNNGPRHY